MPADRRALLAERNVWASVLEGATPFGALYWKCLKKIDRINRQLARMKNA